MSLKIHYGIYQNDRAYCILSQTGKVTAFGQDDGEYVTFSHLENDLSKNVVKIFPSNQGFVALRNDGKVFGWGGSDNQYMNYDISEENKNYVDIFTSEYRIAGIKTNGNVYNWGSQGYIMDENFDAIKTKIIDACESVNRCWIFQREDGTLAASHISAQPYYSNIVFDNVKYTKNVKKIYTNYGPGVALLKNDNSLGYFAYHWTITQSRYGIRGRDGLLGDASVINSGVEKVFTTKYHYLIIKDDGSLHIIGEMVWGADEDERNNNFYVEQYEKLTSGVVDVFSMWEHEHCVCLKDDGTAVALFLDPKSDINDELVDISKVCMHHVIDKNGKVICLKPELYNFESVKSQLQSNVVDVVTTYHASTTSYVGACALKSDGSIVTWGDIRDDKQSGSNLFWDHTHSSYGIRNHDDQVDATLANSGVTDIYASYRNFFILKDDGKMYCWGYTRFVDETKNLTDISNCEYASNNGFLPNYIRFSKKVGGYMANQTMYEDNIVSLNQTSYNSNTYGVPSTMNSFLNFTPDLESGNVYIYLDNQGDGIIENDNIDIKFKLNNGLSTSSIQSILSHNLEQNSSFTFATTNYNSLLDVESLEYKYEKRKKRMQMVRTLFQNNFSITEFFTDNDSLGLDSVFSKTNFKVMHSLFDTELNYNLTEDTSINTTNGFYIILEEKSKCNITIENTILTIECTGIDLSANQLYYISSNKDTTLNYTNSGIYVRNSSPMGPFKDSDKVILDNINIIFDGGVFDNSNSTDEQNYGTVEFVNYVPPLPTRIPIFAGNTGFLGIAKNGYLYSWGNMDSTERVSGSKDANGDWTNSTTDRITDISYVSFGYNNHYAILHNDGTLSNNMWGFPTLDDPKNIWYDNGVKKNDLSELNDIVAIFSLFQFWSSSSYKFNGNTNSDSSGPSSQALLLRQDGSIAVWSRIHDRDDNRNNYLLSDSELEECTPNSSYAKRLMDSTDPNFSKIIKIVVGRNGFIMLREDGRMAVFDKYHTKQRMGRYPRWNQRQSIESHHNVMTTKLQFTLGDSTNTLSSIARDYKSYYGEIVDIGILGSISSDRQAPWYALNKKGQFFLFEEYYYYQNYPSSWFPPREICYGDPAIENPTESKLFKKTIKVYSSFDNNDTGLWGWMLIFDDGSVLTSYSDHTDLMNTYVDLFSISSWNYDSNNTDVKIIDPNDSLSIKKYHGPYIELNSGYLRNITYTNVSSYYNANIKSTAKYYNWNHHQWGIKGTYYGYDENEEPYGDISGVKQIYMIDHSTFCVKTNGELLVWGTQNYVAAKSSSNPITEDIRNKFTNVNKVVGNDYAIAVLRNDGSVFCWGHVAYGGDITSTVPVSSEGISNFTLDEGVLDIYCNQYAFTAVKSDGLIVWGYSSHTNPNDTLDALKNIEWEPKTDGIGYRNNNNMYIQSYGYNGSLNNENLLDYPMYQTNSKIDSIIADLMNAGFDSNLADIILHYPKNIATFNKINFGESLYKGLSKDVIRALIVKLVFNFSPKKNIFESSPEFLALDGKINFNKVDIIKPNNGIINLLNYRHYKGFYVPMEEGDCAVFKTIDNLNLFKITLSNSVYVYEEIENNSGITYDKNPPFTSKVIINEFPLGFKNGIYSGRDIIKQKYNCIANTTWANAYLTNTGKVITWGISAYGGFSHHEDIFTNYSNVTPHSSYHIKEQEETLTEDVVDIISHHDGFVALKSNGTVVTWGSTVQTHTITNHGGTPYLDIPYYTLTKNNTKAIFCNTHGAIAAHLFDNTVVTWGSTSYGGYNHHNVEPIKDIKIVIPSKHGFAAIKYNNDLITWGHDYGSILHPDYGVYSTKHKTVNNFTQKQTKLTNILEYYSNNVSSVAIDHNGHIITWGYSYQTTMPSSLKPIFNTNQFVNVIATEKCFAALDTSGGVIGFGHNNVYTDTAGQWRDISGDVSSNVVRIFASDYDFMCLRSDNVAVGLRGSDRNYGPIDFSNNEIHSSSSYKIHMPPSQYIVGRYKLKDIRDIFSSKYGFAAITIDYNVICWGHKVSYYITDIDPNKIHGGDLSGNEEDGDRPIAIFTNGRSWACLKEDETVVTWEGTYSNTYGTNSYKSGSNYNDPTYGINSEYWGGIDRSSGGAVRGGDGTETTLRNVKNIIPFGDENSYGGYIAICEDTSGNQSTVAWGSDHLTSRWSYSTPNSAGRSFSHICEELNQHSKNVIGIKNNAGHHFGWSISNNENLHEYNFGDRNFNDVPTGFGKPIETIELINAEDVIADILADISNNSTDISTNFIEEAGKEENKLSEDIDEAEAFSEETIKEEKAKLEKIIKLEDFEADPVQLRKQRTSMVRLVFATNPKRTKFVVPNKMLGIKDRFKKDNAVIFKVNFGKATVNLKEDPQITNNTGFYIPLQDGDELTMTNYKGDTKFTVTRSEDKFDDGDSKYYIEITEGKNAPITLYRSETYELKWQNTQGPFKDGDRANIGGVDIEFGSVMEGSPNYSFGDPYINPLCGKPTKLPDANAIYRMIEGFGLYLNASVQKLSKKKQEKMKTWFYNKSGFESEKLGLITNGFYYNKFYISSSNHSLLLDLDKETMFINSDELNYFNISNNYEYENNAISKNEKCNKYTISWEHDILGKINFYIKIYENPQLDNGISIDIENFDQKCKGMMIRNYKPHLMTLDNIKQKHSNKLKRKLRKCKNKFSTRKLVDKNELWVNVKNN